MTLRTLLAALPLTILLACATDNSQVGASPPAEQQNITTDDARAEGARSADGERSCAVGCRVKARSLYTDCMAEADDAVGCRQRAGEWARECAAEKCGEDSAEDQQARGCERRCGMGARAAYSECVEAGGEPETCRPAAGVIHQECVAEQCAEAP